MVMSTTEPMDTPVHPASCPARMAPSSSAIQTTLYDLLAALHAEVEPGEDAVVIAVVVHLLQTYRRHLHERSGTLPAGLGRDRAPDTVRLWGSDTIRVGTHGMFCGKEWRWAF